MTPERDKTQGWFDPLTGDPCELDLIVQKIMTKRTCTVHVGTDSHKAKPSKDNGKKPGYMFATVICLYDPGRGADYYCRKFYSATTYDNLRQRIIDEVSESIDVSLILTERMPNIQISVHADVNSDPRFKTNNYLQQVRSWIQSTGFKFLCKPHAWASSDVADKHAK